jgi:hypothetical protein
MHDRDERERALLELELARKNPRLLIERHFRIRTKDRRLALLRFNAAQNAYYAARSDRDCLLKGRQLGISTLVCGEFLADCLLHPNTTSMIATHDLQTAERLLGIVRTMWASLPAHWAGSHPTRFDNRGELLWPIIGSHLMVGSANTEGLGRGATLTNLLCDEYAFWAHPAETFAGLAEAVVPTGRIVVASTPRGMNAFHDLWVRTLQGETGFKAFFFPWWYAEEYRQKGPPLDGLTPEEAALCQQFGLDHDQIRWRRSKIQLLGESFAQEYPEDHSTAFLTSGRCCFSTPALRTMREQARSHTRRQVEALPLYRWHYGGKRQSGTVTVAPGRLDVWSVPEPGEEYVVGADVAEGLAGRDYCAAIVLHRRSGAQIAELHGRWRPDMFGRLLAALGAWYRTAYLAVEANGHGGTTLHVLNRELAYPRLLYTGNRHRGETIRLGWQTNSRTKPLMVDGLAAAIAEHAITITSSFLLDELSWFVHKDSGAQEAEDGRFDDRAMACSIAWQALKQTIARWSEHRPEGW